MNKHIQIREIPETMHQALKIRAAEEGLSMSDYLKRLIERDLRRPRWNEIRARMGALSPLDLPGATADLMRSERDAH